MGYNSDKGQEYLEDRPAKSMGAKLDDLKKYNTPAPNAYNADKGQDYLEERPARSMGAKLDDLKKYNTLARCCWTSWPSSTMQSSLKMIFQNYYLDCTLRRG